MSDKNMSGSKAFYKAHSGELIRFIHQAQLNGYGNPEAKIETAEDGASVITYQEGDWTYTDKWYGGEPFSGITVVHYQGKPHWSMVYWGRIMPIPRLDQKPVMLCLTEALKRPEPTRPLRGQTKFTASNGYRYRNACTGGVRRFSGEETIIRQIESGNRVPPSKKMKESGTELVYQMNYCGGVINTD